MEKLVIEELNFEERLQYIKQLQKEIELLELRLKCMENLKFEVNFYRKSYYCALEDLKSLQNKVLHLFI